MTTHTGRLGTATTPGGARVGFRDWSLTLSYMNDWWGYITQRNPLLLEGDAVNFLEFEADETGKVLFAGYALLMKHSSRDDALSVQFISHPKYFPENEHFPPVAPVSIFSNDEFALEVVDESEGDNISFSYILRPLDPT